MVGFRGQENKKWDNEKTQFWYIQQYHQELHAPSARGSMAEENYNSSKPYALTYSLTFKEMRQYIIFTPEL